MAELVLQNPFLGNIHQRFQVVTGGQLQIGVNNLDDNVEYVLRGTDQEVTAGQAFIENALVGTLLYNAVTHTYSVTGLDGAVATFTIYDPQAEIDLEDTFPLVGGAGSYVFEIPVSGTYTIIVWGTTKCAKLKVEIP